MQHGCVNLRLGSTAIGICTKEGVETLGIDYMHNDDATEVTELHQHLVPVYQHTPENHSAVVDDSQLWADMWCHLHGLAPISSIFKEFQGDLTRELRSFLWWRRGQPFCEIAILHLQNFGTCRTSMLWTKHFCHKCARGIQMCSVNLCRRVTSPLVDPSSIEKLLEIDFHMGQSPRGTCSAWASLHSDVLHRLTEY